MIFVPKIWDIRTHLDEQIERLKPNTYDRNMYTEMQYSLIANFRGIANSMFIKIELSSTFPDPIYSGL